MNLVSFALRNLARRRMRTALSGLSIALAVASAVSLVSIARTVNQTVSASIDERGSSISVMQRGATDLFGGFLPITLGPRIASLPGVAAVTSELMVFTPSAQGREILISGWPDDSFFWKRTPLKAGRLPHPGESGVAVIGDTAAESLGRGVGDTVEMEGARFRIVGITGFESALNRSLIVTRLADLQAATYRSGQVSFFHVQAAPPATRAELEALKARIEALGGVTASLTAEVMRNDRYVGMLNAISIATSSLALLMGALNVLNTMLFTVQERMREIGVLTAIGWTDRRIMGSIVLEGVVLCAIGCPLGVALGFAASYLFQAIPVVGEYLSFTPTIDLVVPTVLAALGLCLVGAAYPAWRAVQLTPARALQRV